MDNFQKAAVVTAMKKMFKGSHFSICDVDKWLKITGAIPNQQDYETLSALHCVYWNEMSSELRQMVFDKTIEMLSCEGFDLSVLDMTFNNEKKVFELPKQKKRLFRIGS